MAPGRQPDVGADTSRSLESCRIINRRLEAECGNRAHGESPSLMPSATESFFASFQTPPVKPGPHGGVAARPLSCHKENSDFALVQTAALAICCYSIVQNKIGLLKKKRPPIEAATAN